uniref:Ubiquinol-cytochrome c reductase, complex III subunit X n=1 Tax=Electrophorus electricus TaxID=8005 RepID=A0AAY5EKM8_ELEEL
MPAGVSWPRYLKMLGASVLSMFAGAEVVHQYYRPDLVGFQNSATELLGLKAKHEASEKH